MFKFRDEYRDFQWIDRESYNEKIDPGTRASLGQRDRAFPVKGYIDHLARFEEWVVLYDIEANRGWLVDGRSALLHLVRASVSFDNSNPARRDQLERDIKNNYQHIADKETRTLQVLKDMENRRLRLLDDEEYYVENRALELLDLLKVILAEHKQLNKIKDGKLAGFTFRDLAERSKKISKYKKGPLDSFESWISLTRGLNAAVLFGHSFGELFTATKASEMCLWRTMEAGKGYLSVTVGDLRRIIDNEDGRTQTLWELAENVYWRASKDLFAHSPCSRDYSRTSHELPQVLISSIDSHQSSTAFYATVDDLPQAGAVVFGNRSTSLHLLNDVFSTTGDTEMRSDATAPAEDSTRPTTPGGDSQYTENPPAEESSSKCRSS